MSIPFDIVIYALVAAGLFFWLRGILGTRHGDERQRPNPFAQTPEPTRDAAGSPQQPPAPGLPLSNTGPALEDRIGQIARLGAGRTLIALSAVEGLRAIARTDRSFDIDRFFHGAQDAFILIVEAFAKGERDTLKELLSEKVYESFDSVIAGREKERQVASVDVHAVRRVEITEARIEGKDAFVTVRFTADETIVVRDAETRIIEGNPDRVTENIDLWTFGRDLRSRDPTWRVFETREGHPV